MISLQMKTEEFITPKPKPPPKPSPKLETLIEHKDDKIQWLELNWIINYEDPTPKDNTPDCKTCKLLGTLLDTESDINRRKLLTINAMKILQYIYNSTSISTELKIRTFIAYVSSIFLYNSELWSLNKTLENEIDAFHRKQLRYALNIRWPVKISNDDLYECTKVIPWSIVIKRRRLNWLGHLMRLDPETPARNALNELLENNSKKPPGRPPTTWIQIIKQDLALGDIHINIKNKEQTLKILVNLTSNRKIWRAVISRLMGCTP